MFSTSKKLRCRTTSFTEALRFFVLYSVVVLYTRDPVLFSLCLRLSYCCRGFSLSCYDGCSGDPFISALLLLNHVHYGLIWCRIPYATLVAELDLLLFRHPPDPHPVKLSLNIPISHVLLLSLLSFLLLSRPVLIPPTPAKKTDFPL